jgi:D-alanyl-D-alanine carboxypeptidase
MTDTAQTAKLERLLNKLYDLGTVGASVMVVSKKGTWAGAVGMADIASNVPMKPCNLYRIGSTTKTFTVAAAMRLYMQKKLSLDDTISGYLDKEIVDNVANVKTTTIRQLMNHTSKIPDYANNIDYILQCYNLSVKQESARQKLKRIYGKPALEKVTYSSSNALLLGLVISKIEGKPAYEIIKEQVIGPLGLVNTFPGTENPQGLAHAYSNFYGNEKLIDVSFYDKIGLGGEDNVEGGLISNVEDLVKFYQALNSGNFLDSTTWSEMNRISDEKFDFGKDFTGFSPGLEHHTTKYGPAIGHTGDIHGFHCVAFFFPEKDTYISVLINTMSLAFFFINTEELYDYFF